MEGSYKANDEYKEFLKFQSEKKKDSSGIDLKKYSRVLGEKGNLINHIHFTQLHLQVVNLVLKIRQLIFHFKGLLSRGVHYLKAVFVHLNWGQPIGALLHFE